MSNPDHDDERHRGGVPPIVWKAILAVTTVLFSWLAMMIVHEFGHVLHAWASGGRVTNVVLHPLAISRTDVDPNPHPHFVVWGGPLWGCLLPLAAWFLAIRLRWPFESFARFFAGFCLIANGVYIGSGFVSPVGDAAEMLRLGTPAWVMGVFGIVAVPAGLLLWHGLGPKFGLGRSVSNADRVAAVLLAALVLVIAAIEIMISS